MNGIICDEEELVLSATEEDCSLARIGLVEELPEQPLAPYRPVTAPEGSGGAQTIRR